MTIKNQHGKGIARLSLTTLMALVSFSSAQMANAESEAKPSAAAKKKFEDRMQLKYATQVAQINNQWDASKVVLNFVPETRNATQFLSKNVEVFIADDRGKVSMTVEAAMHEYLKQFDRAMADARKTNVGRSKPFPDVSTKMTAQVFDQAVARARLAMSRYSLLQAQLRRNFLDSFGALRDLVPKDEMTFTEQGKGARIGNMAELLPRLDVRFTEIASETLERGGGTLQYNELLKVQNSLKAGTPEESAVHAKTFLSRNLDIIRAVEAKGVEVARKSTIVDVANFNRMAPDHKQALETAKMRQPVGLQVQRVLDKIPRSQIASGRVTLLVGAAGFMASSAVVAGEAEAVDSTASEGKAEFSREWARTSPRKTSR
ncbi:MAG: hypothetical protein JNJ49_14925 [Bdellovibrionaceae bacterium]|nr:hypothetical protein [Pseudobdellovibrionaceae bacterium]